VDRLLKRFDNDKDGDLRLCLHRGVAYQKDMRTGAIEYGDAYHDHYKALEGTAVAQRLNDARVAMVARHAAPGARVLDIGAGCGTFVRAARAAGFETMGYDVIPKTVEALKAMGAFERSPESFDVVTFWDALEHIEDPETALRDIPRGAVAIVAIPVFDDLKNIRASKHYKPGEHLYYFTPEGFTDWMAHYGFRLVETSDHEVAAGRESIGAFAFVRDLPDYRAHIGAYAEMHATRYYGHSATELHLDMVANVVRTLRPASILDYGCGRSDLAAHFWLDGKRRIVRYDPAIPAFKRMPTETFDLVLCCDVLEHVPMASVDRVLAEVRARATRAVFTISTKLARARLPDGRNAHVTLLTRDEWKRWISDYFGTAKLLPSEHEFEVNLLAGPKE
jgi:2-polyprenyl-3-methyl-5-hydroxy-6-metoxy-1,4-benzoquinol methylase